MSIQKTKQDVLDIEDKAQVVVSPEDVKECAKFFQFFEIPIHEGLKLAFEAFIANPTYTNQCELRFQLSEIIAKSTHPVFEDEVFKQVKSEVSEVNEELAFQRQLEKHISE